MSYKKFCNFLEVVGPVPKKKNTKLKEAKPKERSAMKLRCDGREERCLRCSCSSATDDTPDIYRSRESQGNASSTSTETIKSMDDQLDVECKLPPKKLLTREKANKKSSYPLLPVGTSLWLASHVPRCCP